MYVIGSPVLFVVINQGRDLFHIRVMCSLISREGGREHVQPQLCQSARSINTPRLRRAAFSQSSLFCAVWNRFDDEVISRQSSSEVDMDAPRRLASRPWANLLESIFFRRYKCFVSKLCEGFYVRMSYHVIPVTTLCFFIWSASYPPPARPFVSPAPLSHQHLITSFRHFLCCITLYSELGEKNDLQHRKVQCDSHLSQKLKIHQTRLHAHSVLDVWPEARVSLEQSFSEICHERGLLLQNDDGVNMS